MKSSGEDPGTLGQFGTREKDITLDIARYMEEGIIQYLHIKNNPIKSEV